MEINSLTNKIDVNLEIISNLINSSIQIVVSYAGQVLGATIILIIGFYLAGKLSKLVRKKLGVFDKIDPLINSKSPKINEKTKKALTIFLGSKIANKYEINP